MAVRPQEGIVLGETGYPAEEGQEDQGHHPPQFMAYI